MRLCVSGHSYKPLKVFLQINVVNQVKGWVPKVGRSYSEPWVEWQQLASSLKPLLALRDTVAIARFAQHE